ncbi:hypothetical protein KI659_16815 [Litoribacter alkaliphilus]|uniref:Lipoprotein n=1 Tax=Litoribacter ruber TaxID=702568 RepID=A0AAP2G6G6_9BACT|nr:hypothetical protein [Litoribacter alkaliphilus]MBS9525683.1 hypothetical protein [Litoribacter alkaliphilus]
MKSLKFLAFGLLITAFFSCQQELLEEQTIYSNDFTTGNLEEFITQRGIDFYNGDSVLGFFNNEGFSVKLRNLPSHNMVRVTIDLYLHDSWDGNSQDPGGPDIWRMFLDEQEVLNTTFSNSPCESAYCLYQSYPENYVRQFVPKTGAVRGNLPGRCQYAGIPNWTSHYRISKLISHNNSTLTISCLDELVQWNAEDQRCDESWSVNKIEVSVLNIR